MPSRWLNCICGARGRAGRRSSRSTPASMCRAVLPTCGSSRRLVKKQELLAGTGHGAGRAGEVWAAMRLLRAAAARCSLVGPTYLARLPEAVERLQAATGAQLVALAAEGNLAGALLRIGFGSAARLRLPPRVLYLIGAALPQALDPETFVLFQNTHAPRGLPPASRRVWCCRWRPSARRTAAWWTRPARVKSLSAAVAPPGRRCRAGRSSAASRGRWASRALTSQRRPRSAPRWPGQAAGRMRDGMAAPAWLARARRTRFSRRAAGRLGGGAARAVPDQNLLRARRRRMFRLA